MAEDLQWKNLQVKLRMQSRIPQLIPHVPQQHYNLLFLPAQHLTIQPQAERLKPLHDLVPVVQANLLQMRVPRPRANWPADAAMLDVDEACIAEVTLELRARAGVSAGLARCVEERRDPLVGVGLGLERAVFGVILQIEVLELGPAPRGEVAVDKLV